jgi:hypothetical protein
MSGMAAAGAERRGSPVQTTPRRRFTRCGGIVHDGRAGARPCRPVEGPLQFFNSLAQYWDAMKQFPFRFLSLGVSLAVFAALAVTGVVSAQTTSSSSNCVYVRFTFLNPNPGDQLPPGPYLIVGQAQDIRAAGGNGISGVRVFLGSREAGGKYLGAGSFTDPTSPTFTVTGGLPSNGLGPTAFQGIATSAIDGKEYVISVPFTLAFPALPKNTGGQTQGLPPLCSGGVTPSGSPTSAPVAPTPTGAGPELRIINPQSGASIIAGPFSLSGTAFDPATTSGSGVDRVQIFLDSRNSGGQYLGNANLGVGGATGWQATVSLPKNNTGTHALYVYARSSVSGRETATSIPVKITLS